MAYFFRKSVGVGPFRLNFSKSGIGVSVGVKGARLTKTVRGTTYVTVGSVGFYYRETLSGSATGAKRLPPPVFPNAILPHGETRTLPDSARLASSSQMLVQQLNKREKRRNPARIL